MSKYTDTKYACDSCGKALKTCNNNLKIVTSKSESSYWRRLHVKIEHIHGIHNDATTENADLCKACAIKLLADALARVRKGERLSKGVESSNQEGWE